MLTHAEIRSPEDWMRNLPKGTEWVDGKPSEIVATQVVLPGFSIAVDRLLA